MVSEPVGQTWNVLSGCPEPNLSEEECLRIGGHCYEVGNTVGATYPPTYFRQCKHCGKRQTGNPQPPMHWHDDD